MLFVHTLRITRPACGYRSSAKAARRIPGPHGEQEYGTKQQDNANVCALRAGAPRR